MDNYLNKLIEVYKARMTIVLAILLGLITITGYGISEGKPEIFLFSSFLPIFAFFIDLLISAKLAVPFAYKAFLSEEIEEESLGELFTAYASKKNDSYRKILGMKAGVSRQKAFRYHYLRRNIFLKLLIFTFGTIGEFGLWMIFR